MSSPSDSNASAFANPASALLSGETPLHVQSESNAIATPSNPSRTPYERQRNARAEVVPNLKSREQCQCKTGGCGATGRVLIGTGHRRDCVCLNCSRNASAMRRTPLKQRSGKAKGHRFGRLEEGSPEYLRQRVMAKLRGRGACEAVASPDCRGRGEDLHHVKTRARGGSDDARNLKHVCRPCHDWIEANQIEAHARGLLLHSWEDEA